MIELASPAIALGSRRFLTSIGPEVPAAEAYTPSSRRARAYKWATIRLRRTPFVRRVEIPVVVSQALEWREQEAGGQPSSLFGFSSSADERWILQVTDAQGVHVIKAGHTRDAALGREIEFVAYLSSRVDVPLSADYQSIQSDNALILSSRFLRRSGSVSESDVLSLALLLERAGITHGDYASWNILATPDGPRLIDWETATKECIPGFDIVHYVIREMSLVRKRSVRETAHELTNPRGLVERFVQCSSEAQSSRECVRAYLSGPHRGDHSEFAVRFRSELVPYFR